MVATDGSESSERALTFAAKLASASSAELTILTVCESVTDEDTQSFARAERAAIGELLEAKAETMLSHARQTANRLGIADVKLKSVFGDPAAAILNTAQTIRADAIVLGKRGHGRLRGLLLGSVSQKLASLATCPVVIVP